METIENKELPAPKVGNTIKFTEVDEKGFVTFTVTNPSIIAQQDWLDQFVTLTRQYEKDNILLDIHLNADGIAWKMVPKRPISTEKPPSAPKKA